jgi:hypothetical protein
MGDSADALDAIRDRGEQFMAAMRQGRFQDAEAAAPDIFAAAIAAAEQNSAPDWLLTVEALQCEENSDWAGAERAYRQMLALPNPDGSGRYLGHWKLYELFRLLGRADEAATEARLATSAARQEDMPLMLVWALEAEAACCLRRGQIAAAGALIEEGWAALGDDHRFDQSRASLLSLRARCAVGQGRLSQAAADLDAALALLEPMAVMLMAAGVHGVLAHWFSVMGRLRSAQQDREGAVAAWRQAAVEARHVASLPQVQGVYTEAALAEYLRGLAEALAASGRAEDARHAAAEREAILRRRKLPWDVPSAAI